MPILKATVTFKILLAKTTKKETWPLLYSNSACEYDNDVIDENIFDL
jgi:hypothetical protein